jgi:YbbR domain-containing protein
MKTKSILMLAVSVFLSVSVFADTNKNCGQNKEKVCLTGSVVDDKNKETLAGAAVYVDGKKYYSDLDGNFFISDIKPGKYQIKVEFISYKSVVMEIDVDKDEKININLPQS